MNNSQLHEAGVSIILYIDYQDGGNSITESDLGVCNYFKLVELKSYEL